MSRKNIKTSTKVGKIVSRGREPGLVFIILATAPNTLSTVRLSPEFLRKGEICQFKSKIILFRGKIM